MANEVIMNEHCHIARNTVIVLFVTMSVLKMKIVNNRNYTNFMSRDENSHTKLTMPNCSQRFLSLFSSEWCTHIKNKLSTAMT